MEAHDVEWALAVCGSYARMGPTVVNVSLHTPDSRERVVGESGRKGVFVIHFI